MACRRREGIQCFRGQHFAATSKLKITKENKASRDKSSYAFVTLATSPDSVMNVISYDRFPDFHLTGP